jgi:2-dehydro-3-deoxygluconokinase
LKSLDVITFGESMALLTPNSGKSIENSALLDASFGGAESNVAIGLARLGHRSGWFSQLGDDPFGVKILKKIQGEGVDVSRVRLNPNGATGFMLREQVYGKNAVYYYRKNSAASQMQPDAVDEDYIKDAQFLHITGITPALSESCMNTVFHAAALAKKHGVKVCFDPNLRLKLWDIEQARAVVLELAKQADYFLPGLDEMKLLLDTESTDEVMQFMCDLGATSVIKGGSGTTYLVEQNKIKEITYQHSDHVVDTVGAGDGFCAGFISGLLRGFRHEEAVRLGNLVGSMVVQEHGDWEALPTWKQVDIQMNASNHIER